MGMNQEEPQQAIELPVGTSGEQAPKNHDYEKIVETYFKDESNVKTMIHINVDAKYADAVAKEMSTFRQTSDIYLVTGDIDLVVKAHFESYAELKSFILKDISALQGIKETKTFLIVSTYKILGKEL